MRLLKTKRPVSKAIGRICFDLETHPFSKAFVDSKTRAGRIKHAPEMLLGCVYFQRTGECRFFYPRQAASLVAVLQNADEVISYNGKHFDDLVLRRHYGLKGRLPGRGRHVDLCEILTKLSNKRVSLNHAAWLHFGERKFRQGGVVPTLSLHEVRRACQSDVQQTFNLWKCVSQAALIVNVFHQRLWDCPICGGNMDRFYPLNAWLWEDYQRIARQRCNKRPLSMPWRCSIEAKIYVCTNCFLVVNNLNGPHPQPAVYWRELWPYTVWIRRQIATGNFAGLGLGLCPKNLSVPAVLGRRKRLGFSEHEPSPPTLLEGSTSYFEQLLRRMKPNTPPSQGGRARTG